MLFEIEVNGRTRRVTVERTRDAHHRYRVVVDGAAEVVDAVRVAPSQWSLIRPEQGCSSRQVTIREEPGDTFVAQMSGRTYRAAIDGARVRGAGPVGGGAGQQAVTSPMPGKVLRVLVAEGDEVAARQPLVVVEAMKMENEMLAARAGRVASVLVTEGLSVEAGRVLVIVD